jgi:uncharacterized protein YcbK (DUF882 family)
MGNLSESFSRSEFACNCPNECGYDTVDCALLELLEEIRNHFGRRIYINSANRCPAHNRSVGGAENSQHLYGRAADIVVDGIPPEEVYAFCDAMEVPGLGSYSTFTHCDTRSGHARW